MDDEIKSLRDQWYQIQAALKQWDKLLQTREELERNEETLLAELENTRSDSKKELLTTLIKKKRELDHLLDKLEECTEEKAFSLKQSLVETVLRLHPEEEAAYRQLEYEKRSNLSEIEVLKHHLQLCSNLLELLEQASLIRNSVKKLGLFRYIFGTNPNADISQMLHAAGEIADKSIPSLESQNGTAKEFAEFLKDLQQKCQKRWGFNHLDKTLPYLIDTLKEFKTIFNKSLEEKEKESIQIEKRLNALIEKY